jgi:hypothetical protein
MNPIIKMLKEMNVSEEKTKELFKTLTENPMMAMSILGSLKIPMDKIQQVMGQVMANPGLIKEAVQELNLDFSAIEKAKEALKNTVKKD